MQQKRTVGIYMDFPVVEKDGSIGRIYPKANFSKLISQVHRCELDYIKMIGLIMVIDALIVRIQVAGLGEIKVMKDRLTRKKVQNATGELVQFDDQLKQFRCDRNMIVHDFLWKNTDDISEEITKRSNDLMDDLLEHFMKVHLDPDNPGAITLSFPNMWELKTHPPGYGR